MINRIIKLGFPISLMQFGSASLNIINTILVSRYAVEDLAVLGGCNGIFWFIQIVAVAFLWPFDGLFPQENAKERPDKANLLMHGLLIIIFLSIISFIAIQFSVMYLRQSTPSEIISKSENFLRISSLSIPPFLLFFLLQKFWQSFFLTKFFSFITIFFCIVNFITAFILLAPFFSIEIGAIGIAWATVITRCFACFIAIVWAIKEASRQNIKLKFHFYFDKLFFLKSLDLEYPLLCIVQWKCFPSCFFHCLQLYMER